MLKPNLAMLFACAAIAAVPMLIATPASAQAPAAPPALAPSPPPQIPPTLVPSFVVDLMTADGMAAFGAQWKHMEAKIVEGPALQIGNFETAGAKAVLTAYVDDYAEVWLNGQMQRRAGITSPATIQGFNIPNRVVLSDSVKVGDKFQIAIFGINGPISVAPPNFVFFRQASIEFYK